MPAVRILVAEDDPIHAAKIEMLLHELGYDLLGICSSAEEIFRLFVATRPDILVLDIGLKGNEDGVAVADKINAIRPTPIIFATSFEDRETIVRALEANPYAYLVKPIEAPSLQAAIELALRRFSQQDQPLAAEKYAGWADGLMVDDSFFVKSAGKLLKVRHQDILWIEVGQDRYCELVTEKRNYQVRSSMNDLEQKLNPATFVRIHRSHIVNFLKIDGLDESDMTVEVAGRSLPLGGTYKNNLLSRFRTL